MNKCKYLKVKLNHTIYCNKLEKGIQLKDCSNCKYKEYPTKTKKNDGIKKKSAKLSKLERNRFSILTDDLEHCIICGAKRNHLHEVFPGAYRQRSMKEKMVLPLCSYHHSCIHNDIKLSLYWKQICQKEFEKNHTREEFIKMFGKNYLQ